MAILDANIVSILVAIIGIFGLLAPSLFSNYLFNRGDVDIIVLSKNETSSTIILTNDGLGIAKNISLVMKSKNNNFSSIIYEKGTSDIFLYPNYKNSIILPLVTPTTVDASFFKLKIPLLHPGFGSPINLTVNHKETQDGNSVNKTLDVDPQYDFALTHDQGSINVNSIGLLDEYSTKVVFYKTYFIALFVVIGGAIVTLIIIHKHKSFIKSLRNELFHIYSTLKSSPDSKDKFPNLKRLWETQKHTTKIKKHSNDYMNVMDTY